jgi:NADPH:quinone reductase-like Zn-dependent oxidoreductase
MFVEMNAAITLHKMHPVIDRTFGFEEAAQAFTLMGAGGHFGKIVIVRD